MVSFQKEILISWKALASETNPVKPTQCGKPSPHFREEVTTEEHITCVQSLAKQECKMLLLLLRRHLFALSGKKYSCMRSSPQSSTGRYMLLLLLRRHLFVLRGKKHFSQLFSYTALHNPLLLLPTPHCNYLTESEGMSRWSVKILPQALLRYLGAREAETFSSIHCHAQASDVETIIVH